MIFSELYSSYYNAVAEILSLAVKGELTDKAMYDIINNKAFAESVMTIPQSLKDKGREYTRVATLVSPKAHSN